MMLDKLPAKFNITMEVLVESYGAKQTLHDYISEEQTECLPYWLGPNRVTGVDWTEEQHIANGTGHLIRGYSLLERGYGKRILEDCPEELGRAASTCGRLSLLAGTRDEYDCFLNFSGDMLRTMAASDIAVVKKFAQVTPPFAKTGPRESKLLHGGITAVVMRDLDRLDQSIAEYQTWKKPLKYIDCLYATLKGLRDQDASRVVEGLEAMVSVSRKISQLYDLFRYICLEPHGLYELCRWYDPELVVDFEVHRKLPWDTGLYEWVRSNEGKPSHYDVTSLSPLLQEWLVELPFRDGRDITWPEP